MFHLSTRNSLYISIQSYFPLQRLFIQLLSKIHCTEFCTHLQLLFFPGVSFFFKKKEARNDDTNKSFRTRKNTGEPKFSLSSITRKVRSFFVKITLRKSHVVLSLVHHLLLFLHIEFLLLTAYLNVLLPLDPQKIHLHDCMLLVLLFVYGGTYLIFINVIGNGFIQIL